MTSSIKNRPMANTREAGVLIGVLKLPVEAESVHIAREYIGLLFDSWSVPDTENAQLCISELATNVVTHAGEAGTIMLLFVKRFAARIRIEVHDSSARLPVINESMAISESGNGLFLVKALSSNWGSHLKRNNSGKVVWFDMIFSAN